MHSSQTFNFLFVLSTLLGSTIAAPQRNNNGGNNNQNQNGNGVGNTNAGNTNTGNNNGGNAGAATALDAANVQSASDSNGNPDTASGESASLTDPANFINFCSGKTITNGEQNTDGSCNGIVMGDIPSKANMISSIIVNPAPGDNLDANQDFDIQVQVANLVAGSFTPALVTYYAAPQQVKGGKVVGHTHVTIQSLGNSLTPNQPPDAGTFAFFKGINDAGNGNGLLSATVAGGLPAGNYRVCTMTSASNHQPVLMPVAQRGAQDDCTKFTVGGNGGNNNGGNANGNNGNANAGNANTGNANTGNANTGNANTGNANTGNANNGNANTGNANPGNVGPGNANPGNANAGNADTGNGDESTGANNRGGRNGGNAVGAANTDNGQDAVGGNAANEGNSNANRGTTLSTSTVASSGATSTAVSGNGRGDRMDRNRHRFMTREFVR